MNTMRERQELEEEEEDQKPPSILHELSSIAMNIIRSGESSSAARRTAAITPAGFASMLIGISLALMLCGSVTFLIGFMMMPWVIGLAMFFYFAAVVSCLSMIGRSLFSYATSPPNGNDFPAWKVM